MTKREKQLAWALPILALTLSIVTLWAPEPVDWTESFEHDETRPYASTIIYETLPDVLSGGVERVDASPYVHLADSTRTGTTYLFITSKFDPGPSETNRLLRYVESGNTVFVAAEEFRGPLADSLGLGTDLHDVHVDRFFGSDVMTTAYDTLRFTRPGVSRRNPYLARNGTVRFELDVSDSTRADVLAVMGTEPVLVNVRRGKGRVLASSTPRLFTNVNAVSDTTSEAVYAALSHLDPEHTVLWDTRHKPLIAEVNSPFRFILSVPALQSALYLALAGLALFLLVRARRRQRPVPVVEPPSNDTLEFVETVGDLYYREGNHADLARRRIDAFRTYLRTTLNVRPDGSDDLAERIARRSGVPREEVDATLLAIRSASQTGSLSGEDLLRLGRRLDRFYQSDTRPG